MSLTKRLCLIILSCLLATALGCSPEVGSKEWCDNMKKKPKRDWSANDAADYTKHCIFK